jgi:hypothetical protein
MLNPDAASSGAPLRYSKKMHDKAPAPRQPLVLLPSFTGKTLPPRLTLYRSTKRGLNPILQLDRHWGQISVTRTGPPLWRSRGACLIRIWCLQARSILRAQYVRLIYAT